MMIRKRTILAFFLAGGTVLLPGHPVHSSYNSEAGRAYNIACRRLNDLKKSPRKKQYRSYWFDCIRAFELVERKYAKSWYAGDACFCRADIYRRLYQHSRFAKDIDASLQTYADCQTAYPKHPRAPEALYRILEIALFYKKDAARAVDAYSLLSKSYPATRWTPRAKDRLKHTAPREYARLEQKISDASGEKSVAAAVLKKIRYRSGGDYTRIVIDQEKKAAFQVLELSNPPRLVFDLLNSRLGPSVQREPLAVNDGILRQVRASQYAPDTVRVVLDLASIKSYAAFPLRDPPRLVIDVTGEGSRGPDATPGTGGADGPERKAAPETTAQPRAGTGRAAGTSIFQSGRELSLSRQMGLKVRTIAIDAGHGGHDPGAIGRRGTKEKNITLDIAKRLAALVGEGLGCEVIMTRDRDVFIPLEDRAAIARTKGADLFVSIHVNANRRRSARGIETYIQGLRPSDRDAMETAARENAATTKTLSDLDDELKKILIGLRMENNDEESIRLAHSVQASLVNAKPVPHHPADLGVKRAFFYVLINTGMPGILAEVGFLSNPAEETLLRKKSYRQAIAEAVYNGLKKYMLSRQPRR